MINEHRSTINVWLRVTDDMPDFCEWFGRAKGARMSQQDEAAVSAAMAGLAAPYESRIRQLEAVLAAISSALNDPRPSAWETLDKIEKLIESSGDKIV